MTAHRKHSLEPAGQRDKDRAEDEHVLEGSDTLLEGKLSNWSAQFFKPGDLIAIKDCFVIQQAGDGLCLYASVAEWLVPQENAYAVRQISPETSKGAVGREGWKTGERQQAVGALKTASATFILENRKALQDANVVVQEDVGHAQRSASGNSWGGMPEICAMSFLLNAPIVVWTEHAERSWMYIVRFSTFHLLRRAPSLRLIGWNKLSENREGTVIHILFWGKHYDTVVIAKRGTRS